MKVMIGKNGQLFLDNDSNRVVDQVMGKFPLTDNIRKSIKLEFEKRVLWAKIKKFKYIHLIPPNGHCVYAENLPDECVVSANRMAIYLSEQYRNVVLYPLDILREYKGRGRVYYQTDTHWTSLGAAICFNKISDLMDLKTKIDVEQNMIEKVRCGDLGSKLTPKLSERYLDFLTDRKVKTVFCNNIDNNGRYLHTVSDNKNGLRCVIFGDSFTNSAIDVVSCFFSEVYYFRATIFDLEIISKLNPDIVITEVTERFFNGAFERRSYYDILLEKLLLLVDEKPELLDIVNLDDDMFTEDMRDILIDLKQNRKKV